jgi:anti-sigma B factor antagonist
MTEPQDFSIRTASEGDAFVVAPTGEIDLATAPELAGSLEAAPPGVRHVVVDLTDVSFIDSSGINVLLTAERRLAEGGAGFRVVAPPGPVRRVFELTQLVDSLGVVDSIGDALAESAQG